MITGRKNMIFGFFYFTLTLGLGMYLAYKIGGDKVWAASKTREILATAHVHGNMEAFLNIVLGYLLCKLSLNIKLSNLASILLIVGAICHSGTFYLTGLGIPVIFMAPIGAIAIVSSMGIIGVGLITIPDKL